MKKKVFGITAILVLVAALTLCLVGCTVSGTYENKSGTLTFSGKEYTQKVGIIEVTGTFKTEAMKTEYETSLGALSIDQQYVNGVIIYMNKDGKEIGVGFYGTDKDGKDYATYLLLVYTKK